jgi:hypothetical protein
MYGTNYIVKFGTVHCALLWVSFVIIIILIVCACTFVIVVHWGLAIRTKLLSKEEC